MKIIQSQKVSYPLTHVTMNMQTFDSMIKNGIKLKILKEGILYKPNAFWVSMNYDWEKWCRANDFCNIDKAVVCDVQLKSNLNLLKVTSPEDADEIIDILMPNMNRRFSALSGRGRKSDLICFLDYLSNILRNKEMPLPTPTDLWKPITQDYDGIYFKNSFDLHFETFFNSWDCHSIALFDPYNVALSNPRLGKGVGMEEELEH